MDKDISINFNDLLQNSQNKDNFEKNRLVEILNYLPFGISVQNRKRTILYENSKAKELNGCVKNKKCFSKWNYIEGEGNSICKDCPATVSFIDGTQHKIFRKTVNHDSNEMYLEIQTIPILEEDGTFDKYIEIINDVTHDERIRTLAKKPVSLTIEDLQFSLSIYGKTGGEVLVKNKLEFLSNPEESIQRLITFTFIGIFQNNENQVGLFGPLPVIDIIAKSMIVYSFRLQSSLVTDPRKHGFESCLFITFLDREDYYIFEKREKILNFLKKAFESKKVEDLDNKWFKSFETSFKDYLLELHSNYL